MQRNSEFGVKRAWIFALLLGANFSVYAQEQAKPMPKANDAKLAGQIYSPAFCPMYPDVVAYERQIEDVQELYLYNYSNGDIQLIRATGAAGAKAEDQFKSLFESADLADYTRFEGQLDWRPEPDNLGRHWFIFVSNGGAKSFDLYLSSIDRFGKLAAEPPLLLAHDGVDLYPKWSPDGNSLVFVSGDKSGSDLFLVRGMENLLKQRNTGLFRPVKITANPEEDNFPAWSPDSKSIAYQSLLAENGLLNMGINLIHVDDLAGAAVPRSIRLTAELGAYHEYNPSWNARGNYIAYYVSQARVGQTGDNRLLDIGVLTVIPNAVTKRAANGRVLSGTSPRLAKNVIPNRNHGPSWGSRCAEDLYAGTLFYVKRNEQNFNPLTRASLMKWQNKDFDYEGAITIFATRLHRDITATHFKYDDKTGRSRFAYVSQEQNANRLQVRELPIRATAALAACIPLFKPALAQLTDRQTKDKTGESGGKTEQPERPIETRQWGEKSRPAAVGLSFLFPGAGQLYKGQKTKALVFGTAGVAALAAIYKFNQTYKDREKTFFVKGARYDSADGFTQLNDRLSDEKKFYVNQLKPAEKNTKIVFGVVAGIWALNIIDSAIGTPNTGAPRTFRLRKTSRMTFPEPYMSYDKGIWRYSIGARIEF